jgi:MSHA biogenesis protein MshM
MYLSHFGLTELPFGITPDTAFAFATRSHQEALNTLLVALESGEGFIKITGEVGTGKTLLCRRLLATLDPARHVTAYLPNPLLNARTLLQALAEELGVTVDPAHGRHAMVKALNLALLHLAAQDKTVVLCLDEAQALPVESLEALRLLSNLETEKRKLLHVVLFGQPELDTKLACPEIRQLRQRIAFAYTLKGLQADELELYLAHRLRVAGYRDPALFRGRALRLLHRASKGVPRLVNILAHKSLLLAFGEGSRMVLPRHVTAAARDSSEARTSRFSLTWWVGLALAASAGALWAAWP